MSIIVEGPHRVLLGGQAYVLEEDRELAWAAPHVIKNDALRYVLGKFVEADNANNNGHVFDLAELPAAQRTIPNSPLNMLHRPHYIVGNFVASELVYPTGVTAAEDSLIPGDTHPFVESLAAFYRYYFPDEYDTVEKAHKDGSLFYSMECVPETVKCAAVCQAEFAYDGRTSDTYCAHLNQPRAVKRLGKPHFTGGALIVPPTLPGWKHADITQLSSLLTERGIEAELTYDQLSREFPHLESRRWESMMAQLLEMAALPSPPSVLPHIVSPDDLANAIKQVGKKPPGLIDPKVKKHLIKQAKALGKTDLIPSGWDVV